MELFWKARELTFEVTGDQNPNAVETNPVMNSTRGVSSSFSRLDLKWLWSLLTAAAEEKGIAFFVFRSVRQNWMQFSSYVPFCGAHVTCNDPSCCNLLVTSATLSCWTQHRSSEEASNSHSCKPCARLDALARNSYLSCNCCLSQNTEPVPGFHMSPSFPAPENKIEIFW